MNDEYQTTKDETNEEPNAVAQPDNDTDTNYLRERDAAEETLKRQINEYAETKDEDGHQP